MAAPAAAGPVRAPTLYALAFCSGVAALVYQVVWAKSLSLTFGSTTLAASAVVGGFMGGMGIGAWLYHRVYERAHEALRLYGFLEVGIALAALALTATLPLLPNLFVEVASLLSSGLPLTVFRVGSVFLLLLVPAALMGATYPALCTAVIDSERAVDRHLGTLYGLNTLGAAAGALLAGLVLVEVLGLWGSVLAANLLNVAVGGTALVLARRAPEGAVARPTWASDAPIETGLPRGVTAVVLVGSGLATLSYEILWFRALRYLFGNSTYALSTMLLVFLVGLGLGALLLRPIARRGLAERGLAFSQLAIAVLAVGAMALESLLLRSDWLLGRVSIFASSAWDTPWWERLVAQGAAALVILLPAVLFMGLAFPLATRLYLGSLRHLGKRIGGAYLLANIGSITGAILAAVFLLPAFGTVGGTRLVAGFNLLLGLLVLVALRLPARTTVAWATVAVAAFLGLGWTLPERLPFAGWGMEVAEGELLFEEEGDLATVQVRRHPEQSDVLAMTIDGAIIGVSGPWHYGTYQKQVLLAHLPLALDRDVRRTLNVGLGSGSTVASLAAYPQVETLEIVEISGAVQRGAALFPYARVLDDPRTRLFVEDVFHHLLRTDQRYDLIVSDGKQNRAFQGNAKILSKEFYEHSLDRLAPEGMLVQWIPLSSLEEEYRIILRTFCEVMPHVEVFFFSPDASLVVGSRARIFGRDGITDAELPPAAERELASVGIHNVSQLRAGWVANRDGLLEVLGSGTTNQWNRLVLEYTSYRATRADWLHVFEKNLALLERAHEDASAAPQHAAILETPEGRSVRLLRRAYLQLGNGDTRSARAAAQEALEADPHNEAAVRLLEQMRQAGLG